MPKAIKVRRLRCPSLAKPALGGLDSHTGYLFVAAFVLVHVAHRVLEFLL